MIYTEVSIFTTTEASEIIADILGDYSTLGVSVFDKNDVLDLIRTNKASWDYASDEIYNQNEVVVKGYIEKKVFKKVIPQIEERLSLFRQNAFCDYGTLNLTFEDVDGDFWREKWKEGFKPIHIDKIVVCPDWIKYEKQQDEIVVYIDSNMAFGTGEHETTSSCIKLLQKYIKPESTVIDIGCGSGILGICASKLNAKKVIMTDIDETAVTYAKHNCDLNHVENADVFHKNLLDDTSVKGDILLANIMAEVLIGFAPNIDKNMNENAVVILSGILISKKQEVIDAYTKNGFNVIDEITKGEWCALALNK